MPLFVCDDCGCVDNTASGHYWSRNDNCFGEQYVGKALCAQCSPAVFKDGSLNDEGGKWHGYFAKKKPSSEGLAKGWYVNRPKFDGPFYENGIAITGGIGTGKSTVCNILRDLGYAVFDADQLSRAVVEPGTEGFKAVVKAFGKDILTEGVIDRKRLGSIVFADDALRKQLEAIIHPLVAAKLREEAEKIDGKRFFYEAALLYEFGLEKHFKAVWATICTKKEQVSRIQARDGRDLEVIAKILEAQMSPLEKCERADVTIVTDGELEYVKAQVVYALGTVTG